MSISFSFRRLSLMVTSKSKKKVAFKKCDYVYQLRRIYVYILFLSTFKILNKLFLHTGGKFAV